MILYSPPQDIKDTVDSIVNPKKIITGAVSSEQFLDEQRRRNAGAQKSA